MLDSCRLVSLLLLIHKLCTSMQKVIIWIDTYVWLLHYLNSFVRWLRRPPDCCVGCSCCPKAPMARGLPLKPLHESYQGESWPRSKLDVRRCLLHVIGLVDTYQRRKRSSLLAWIFIVWFYDSTGKSTAFFGQNAVRGTQVPDSFWGRLAFHGTLLVKQTLEKNSERSQNLLENVRKRQNESRTEPECQVRVLVLMIFFIWTDPHTLCF